MIAISSSLVSLQVVLDEVKTTSECEVAVSAYAALSGGLPWTTLTRTNGTTAVEVLETGRASPARVDTVLIRNADTVTHGVKLFINDISSGASENYTLWKGEVPAGSIFQWRPDGTSVTDDSRGVPMLTSDTRAKEKLSGSTSGKGVKVSATATAGTLIHTAVAGGTELDLITIYAQNNHTAPVLATLEWGGVASPDDLIQMEIPEKSGMFQLTDDLPLNGGLLVRCFAATTNVISIHGYHRRALP